MCSVSPVQQTPTPLHRLCQQRTISFFSYSYYHSRGTDMVTSILGGNGRKNFSGLHAHSLASHFATCRVASLKNLCVGSVSTHQIFCAPLLTLVLYSKLRQKQSNTVGISRLLVFWPVNSYLGTAPKIIVFFL